MNQRDLITQMMMRQGGGRSILPDDFLGAPMRQPMQPENIPPDDSFLGRYSHAGPDQPQITSPDDSFLGRDPQNFGGGRGPTSERFNQAYQDLIRPLPRQYEGESIIPKDFLGG
jgi:hypothetical protein